MIRYVFRDAPNPIVKRVKKADPQKIGEALDEVKRATKGKCNARTFLKAATDRSNYLHRFLEWNDRVAGHAHRLEQMRELVRCIDIVSPDDDDKQIPAFISLTADKGGRSYHLVQDVLESVDLQVAALKQARADLESYERRFAAFDDLCSALRKARELIDERIEKNKRGRKGRKDDDGDRPHV